MSRKKLKSYKRDDEGTRNRTIRERHLARMLSLIFHLNNNQSRYSFSYNGYMFVLQKYNFSAKQYELVEEHNFTKMDYHQSYLIIRKINKRLYDELLSFSVEFDCEWDEEDEEQCIN